jgi:hypothetical protein
MVFSEAIWVGKTNKEIALKIFRNYMKTDDPKRLEKISAWLRRQGEHASFEKIGHRFIN